MTVVRITDGTHDLILSSAHVRKVALEEIGRFTEAYVRAEPKSVDRTVESDAQPA